MEQFVHSVPTFLVNNKDERRDHVTTKWCQVARNVIGKYYGEGNTDTSAITPYSNQQLMIRFGGCVQENNQAMLNRALQHHSSPRTDH